VQPSGKTCYVTYLWLRPQARRRDDSSAG
jgi:hypothetical protein